MRGADVGGDLALERLALGAEDIASGGEHAAHRGVDFGLEQAVFRRGVDHRNGGIHPNLCSRSRTSLPTSSARPSALRPPSPSTPAAGSPRTALTKLSACAASASPPAWLSSSSSMTPCVCLT